MIDGPILHSIYKHVDVCIIYFYLFFLMLSSFFAGKLLLILLYIKYQIPFRLLLKYYF